jgi:hypothetical protein
MLLRMNARVDTIGRIQRMGTKIYRSCQPTAMIRVLPPFSVSLRIGVWGFHLVVVAGGLLLGGILDLNLYKEIFLAQTPHHLLDESLRSCPFLPRHHASIFDL